MLPQYIAKQFTHLENVQETVPMFLDEKGEMLPEGAENAIYRSKILPDVKTKCYLKKQ